MQGLPSSKIQNIVCCDSKLAFQVASSLIGTQEAIMSLFLQGQTCGNGWVNSLLEWHLKEALS